MLKELDWISKSIESAYFSTDITLDSMIIEFVPLLGMVVHCMNNRTIVDIDGYGFVFRRSDFSNHIHPRS